MKRKTVFILSMVAIIIAIAVFWTQFNPAARRIGTLGELAGQPEGTVSEITVIKKFFESTADNSPDRFSETDPVFIADFLAVMDELNIYYEGSSKGAIGVYTDCEVILTGNDGTKTNFEILVSRSAVRDENEFIYSLEESGARRKLLKLIEDGFTEETAENLEIVTNLEDAAIVDWGFLRKVPEGNLNNTVLGEINRLFYPEIRVGENEFCGNPNALHCIINSEFSKPEDMDLLMFLRHFPYREEMSAEEKTDLENSNIWTHDRGVDDLPFPTTKTSRKKADEILIRYLGITTDDLNNGSDIDYLEKYDSYYTYFSDYGPGMFTCIKGFKKDHKVYLFGEAGGAGFFNLDDYTGMAKLTLYEAGDGYMIEAFEAV